MARSSPNTRLKQTFIQGPSQLFAHLFVALPCEAKPLVSRYRLKRRMDEHEFTIYQNETISLTVTGIGQAAMAAGVAYCKALYKSDAQQVLLNMGVAGHQSHRLGDVFLAEKITDDNSGKNWYPPLVFVTDCLGEQVRTVAKPEFNYPEATLYDMEASAFYETATRFATAELVQCIKIVSDNANTPATAIRPNEVSKLIEQNLDVVDAILHKLKKLRDLIYAEHPQLLQTFLDGWYFSSNQQQQLTKILSRWQTLAPDKPPSPEAMRAHQTGGEVLHRLQHEVEKLPISFC